MNTMSLFFLIKPVFIFTFNRERLLYLTTVPFCLLLLFSLLAYRFPIVFLADTAEPGVAVNLYMLVGGVLLFGFTFLSLMLKTQRILFFGETEKKGRFFIPVPDRSFWLYLFTCVRIFCLALAFSAVVTVLFLLLIRSFGDYSEKKGLIFLFGMVFFTPYFMSRFVMKLPAQAAGRSLRWFGAWLMVGRLTVMTMAMLAMFFIVPMGAASFLSMKLSLLHSIVLTFLSNAGMVYSVLLSCVMQSAFCGYEYSVLSSKA